MLKQPDLGLRPFAAGFGLLALISTGLAVTSIMSTPAKAAQSATPMSVHLTKVTGRFQGGAETVMNVVAQGDLYSVVVSSGDTWHGDFSGTTTYSGPALFDPKTNATEATLNEVFTGTVRGVGTGQVFLVEDLHSAPPKLGSVDCVITGGSGQLAGIHGFLHFQATRVINPDPTGNGITYGHYSGRVFR